MQSSDHRTRVSAPRAGAAAASGAEAASAIDRREFRRTASMPLDRGPGLVEIAPGQILRRDPEGRVAHVAEHPAEGMLAGKVEEAEGGIVDASRLLRGGRVAEHLRIFRPPVGRSVELAFHRLINPRRDERGQLPVAGPGADRRGGGGDDGASDAPADRPLVLRMPYR